MAAQPASNSTTRQLLELVHADRYVDLGQTAVKALLSRAPDVEPWLLSVVLESANRLASDSDLLQHHLSQAEQTAARVDHDRDQLLALLEPFSSAPSDPPERDSYPSGFVRPEPTGACLCRLTVRSFGPLLVHVDGREVTGWNGNKSQLVLSVLLAQPRMSASKDVLMEALWYDAEPSTSRRRLHQAVYTLRKAFSVVRPDVEFVLFDRDHYLINPDLTVESDVTSFAGLVTSCRSGALSDPARLPTLARSLLELYRADFLDDDPYEDWVIRERERLRLQFFSTAEQLADSLLGAGHVDDAARLVQRVLELDPTDEPAHRNMMRAHHLAGRHHFVSAQFRTCTNALRTHLGLEPSQKTRALYEELMGAEEGPPSDGPGASLH